ncbi:MAG: DUF5333 domain-containing protein, partial [Halocynthiibacter sp.]
SAAMMGAARRGVSALGVLALGVPALGAAVLTRTLTRTVALILTLILAQATTSGAQAATLRENFEVNNGLIIAGIAEAIYETCPTISVRKLRGVLYLRSLYVMARQAGFSKAEIEAYVEDEDQETRLRLRAETYMAARGVVEGDTESYCALGRAAIASRNQIGVMLRID